jgi:hypothetical protein
VSTDNRRHHQRRHRADRRGAPPTNLPTIGKTRHRQLA